MTIENIVSVTKKLKYRKILGLKGIIEEIWERNWRDVYEDI